MASVDKDAPSVSAEELAGRIRETAGDACAAEVLRVAIRAAESAAYARGLAVAQEQCWIEAAGEDSDGARRAGACARRIGALAGAEEMTQKEKK